MDLKTTGKRERALRASSERSRAARYELERQTANLASGIIKKEIGRAGVRGFVSYRMTSPHNHLLEVAIVDATRPGYYMLDIRLEYPAYGDPEVVMIWPGDEGLEKLALPLDNASLAALAECAANVLRDIHERDWMR